MKQKNKLKGLGFSFGHYAMIAFFVVITLGLTLSKEPLLLGNLTGLKFLQANEEAQSQEVPQANVADVSYDGINEIVEEKNELLSLIDPSFNDGSVLGANSLGQQAVEDILSADNVNQISINVVSDSETRIVKYYDQLNLVESYNGSILIFSALSEQNPNSAAKTIPVIKSLVGELKTLEVPQSFARYHRLKLMQYGVMLNMAQNISGEVSPEDRAAAGIVFFEITNAIEAENAELIKKFGFSL